MTMQWQRYSNPLTTRCRYVGHIGDVDPVEHGGGFVRLCGDTYEVEYTHGLEETEEGGKLTIYRDTVEEDVLVDKNWADIEAVARTHGQDVDEVRRAAKSSNIMERVSVMEMIAGHYGWHEFDQYPLTLTRGELNQRWRAGYKAIRDRRI